MEFKKKEEVRGMCFGTFDNLHQGHIDFFQQARKRCSELIVVVARDKNVEMIKGASPGQNEEERKRVVDNLSLVEKAVLGGIRDKYKIIKEFNPEIIFLGYDQEANQGEIKKIHSGRIIRLKPYKPEIYKSSKIK